MNILLIYKVLEQSEKLVLDAISDLLLKNNHSVAKISNNDANTIEYEQFSLVLIYNVILIEEVIRTIEKAYIPKILILEESKIFHNYFTIKLNQYDKILLLKEHGTKTASYLPKALIEYLRYPFSTTKKEIKYLTKNERLKILVAFKSNYVNELLIRIIPVLNHFLFDFTIISDQMYIPKFLNENIRIKNWKDFDCELKDSDLVIGNGFVALEAIIAEKPLIVVGDNGLGGFITQQNIEIQYNAFFSGRVGGEIKEHIPQNLLIDEIITITEMEENEKQLLLRQNKYFLGKQEEYFSKYLNDKLLKIVDDYNEVKDNLANCQVKISSEFELVSLNKDCYVIYMGMVNHFHSMIDKESFEIIQKFKDGNKVSKIMAETSNIDKEEFKSFIVELLNEKILTIQ